MNDEIADVGSGIARRSVAAVLVSAPALVIVWSLLAWMPALPAELPTQWAGDEVVSRLPTFVFAGSAVAISGGAALFAWHAAMSPRNGEYHRRGFLISGSVAGATAAAWLISVIVARHPGQEIGGAGLLAVAALFYGLFPFACAPANVPTGERGNPDELDITQTEILAWSQTQVVPIFVWASVACVLVAIAFGYLPWFLAGPEGSNLTFAIVASLLVVMFSAFARVRVTVDLRGLRALSGTIGIRLLSVGLEDVTSVRTITLEPLRWGGWGYRIGARGRALVLRGGPAIVVTLRGGGEIAVTTPDAEQALSVFRALLRRRDS